MYLSTNVTKIDQNLCSPLILSWKTDVNANYKWQHLSNSKLALFELYKDEN